MRIDASSGPATDVLEAIAFVHLEAAPPGSIEPDLEVLVAQAAEREGTLVKRLPTGCLLAFPSGSAALDWASRELARRSAGGLRIGLSVGDVVVDEDDRFGLTVVEAARLCSAADDGVGLATLQTAQVAGVDTTGAEHGPLDLKGLGDVDTVRIGPAMVRPPGPAGEPRPRLGAILITDLVNSTRLVAPLSREEAEALRRSHFGILRGVSDRHGGREIANLGDGLVLEFPSVTAAIEAAMAMHRSLARHNRQAEVELVVRTSLAAGELSGLDRWDEPAMARSLALQELAGAGEIVLDALALRLTSDRAREAVELDEAEHPDARLVRWKARHLVPLPTQMAAPQRVGFAGREAETAVLAKAWSTAVGGTSTAVLVSGEAGIGKSRLSKEVALSVFEEGGVVLHGRCGEELAIPYQPIVQALDHLVAHLPEGVLAEYVEQYGGALVQIVPDLRRRVPVEPATTSPGVDGRLALFEAIAGLLKTTAALEPTILVLEDLHWADPGTALLLKHLVRSIHDAPLMVVGNFRPVALDDQQPIASALADLRGEHNIERIDLSGLDATGVIGMLTHAAGQELDHDAIELAKRIQHECGGNPFMVNEILLHLVETQAVVHVEGQWRLASEVAPLHIPASVREVISQRIARLGEVTQSVLRTAAVIGMVFDFDTLVAVSRQEEDDILDALDDAVAAALLWDPSDFDGRFSFGHAVFQKTLYEELGPTRRARTHRQIAEQLEASGRGRPAELARHWSAAGAVGDRAKVCEYSQLAAEAALGELAYEAAVDHFRTALETADRDDESQRIDLLLQLGGAQRAAGVPEFTATFQQAARLAHERGDAERVAQAALGASLAGTWRGAAGTVVDDLVDLLEQALRDIGDAHPLLRARLLAQLAAESYWTSKRAYTRALLDEALALARSLGEPTTLASVLATRLRCLNEPDNLSERLDASTELLELVTPLGDLAMTVDATMYRGVAVLEAGELDEWGRRLEECEHLAARAKQPFVAWRVAYLRAMVDVMRDTAEGEASATAAFEAGSPLNDDDVFTLFATSLFIIRFHQGRAPELVPTMRELVAGREGIPVWRAVLALSLAEAGELEEARRLAHEAVFERHSHTERDHVWWGTIVVLSEAAWLLRDVPLAEALLVEVAPFVDHITCVGLGTASTGAAARSVAQLESVLGRFDEADAHFELAHAVNARAEARCFEIRALHNHATLLLERDGPGDRARVSELLDGAPELAASLGMGPHAEQLAALATLAAVAP